MNPRDSANSTKDEKKLADHFSFLNNLLLAANACSKLGKPSLDTKNAKTSTPTYQKTSALLPDLLTNNPEVSNKILTLILDDTEMTQTELEALQHQLLAIYNELLNIPSPQNIPSDDELRNVNSFEYLRQLAHFIPPTLRSREGFAIVWNTCQFDSKYDYHHPYGNYYTKFLIALEEHLNYINGLIDRANKNKRAAEVKNHTEHLHSLDALINAIYMNHNAALQRAYMMIRDTLQETHQTDYKQTASAAQERLINKNKPLERQHGENIDTPTYKGSILQRVAANAGPVAQPMTTTSQPSMIHFAYKKLSDPQQLRFGTQGQILDFTASVNAIFLHWLDSKWRAVGAPDDKKITHIYFNNLSRIGGNAVLFDFKRKSREDNFTKKLETLETTQPGIAVITLPASNSLLNYDFTTNRKPSTPCGETKKKIMAIVNQTSTDIYAKDFHISLETKNKLFKSNFDYDQTMENLLQMSLEKLGFADVKMLSPADEQAIYFHFLKYELPNYILEKLHPDTFNFSCKDAIDRGGVSSAYYNLIKSIELGKPLSQNEFECILHGAPIIVKGRTMNKNIILIWNAIDAYLEASKTKENIPSWLIEWRNKHALPHTPYYFVKRLEAYIKSHAKDAPRTGLNSLIYFGEREKRGKLAKELLEEFRKALESKNNHRAHSFQCNFFSTRVDYNELHKDTLGTLIAEIEEDKFLICKVH